MFPCMRAAVANGAVEYTLQFPAPSKKTKQLAARLIFTFALSTVIGTIASIALWTLKSLSLQPAVGIDLTIKAFVIVGSSFAIATILGASIAIFLCGGVKHFTSEIDQFLR